MNRSTPGLPVHYQLPEFTQIHVHRVSDAIQPSHPLSSPSPYGSFLMGETDSRKLGLVLMGGAMLSKSLIQFSVDGQGCVPFLLFDWRPNYGGGNEGNGDLLQKAPCMHWCTQFPRA